MKTNTHTRYSEAFKRQVVEQIQSGKFRTVSEAMRAYGIRGSRTINGWLKHYGCEDCLPKRIKIMSIDEINETQKLKKRVRALEAALADAQMRSLLSESFLNIACERMKTDTQSFKKKHATELSTMPGKADLQ